MISGVKFLFKYSLHNASRESSSRGGLALKENDRFNFRVTLKKMTHQISSAMLLEFELELGGCEVAVVGGVGNKPGTGQKINHIKFATINILVSYIILLYKVVPGFRSHIINVMQNFMCKI